MTQVFSSRSFYTRSSKFDLNKISIQQKATISQCSKASDHHKGIITPTDQSLQDNLIQQKCKHLKAIKTHSRKLKYKAHEVKKVLKNLKKKDCDERQILTSESDLKDSRFREERDLIGIKRFFKKRNTEVMKKFTKDLFQPKKESILSNKDGRISVDLSVYKSMSTCLTDQHEDDDEEEEDDADDDDCSSEAFSEDEELKHGMGDGIFEREEETEVEGIKFSVVSDDEDDAEDKDDDISRSLNDKLWAGCEEEEGVMESSDDGSLEHCSIASTDTPEDTIATTAMLTDELPLSQDKPPQTAPVKHKPQGKLHQMTLDFGQRLKEPLTCAQCGLMYNANEASDRSFHLTYHHKHLHRFQYTIRHKDHVVGVFEDGHVIKLTSDVINSPKMQRLLQEVEQETDISLPQHPSSSSPSSSSSRMKAFIFVKEKRMVGVCLVERIEKAHRRATDDNLSHLDVHKHLPDHSLSSCSGEDEEEEEGVRAGVRLIWVHEQERRKKIATRLLHAVRGFLCLGVPLQSSHLAFASPTTASCTALATHFTSTPRFLLYHP